MPSGDAPSVASTGAPSTCHQRTATPSHCCGARLDKENTFPLFVLFPCVWVRLIYFYLQVRRALSIDTSFDLDEATQVASGDGSFLGERDEGTM